MDINGKGGLFSRQGITGGRDDRRAGDRSGLDYNPYRTVMITNLELLQSTGQYINNNINQSKIIGVIRHEKQSGGTWNISGN